MNAAIDDFVGAVVEVISTRAGGEYSDEGVLAAYDESWLQLDKAGESLWFPVSAVCLLAVQGWAEPRRPIDALLRPACEDYLPPAGPAAAPILDALVGNQVQVRIAAGHAYDGILRAFEAPWLRLESAEGVFCVSTYRLRLVKLRKRLRPLGPGDVLLRPAGGDRE